MKQSNHVISTWVGGKEYQCKDNDNLIRVQLSDGKVEEIWIKGPIDNGWTVIGWNDIQDAIKEAKNQIQ